MSSTRFINLSLELCDGSTNSGFTKHPRNSNPFLVVPVVAFLDRSQGLYAFIPSSFNRRLAKRKACLAAPSFGASSKKSSMYRMQTTLPLFSSRSKLDSRIFPARGDSGLPCGMPRSFKGNKPATSPSSSKFTRFVAVASPNNDEISRSPVTSRTNPWTFSRGIFVNPLCQ